LRLTYGDVRVLLPGDIEAAAERDLVRTFGSTLQSRVVKVPHHGSGSSSTEPFVAAATGSTATRAVVSVGQSGRFGMPDPTVLSRWASADARVRSTAHRGAVWLRTDGRTVWSVDWR
jgi:competence protein ComEC